jgi:hypothetical protein
MSGYVRQAIEAGIQNSNESRTVDVKKHPWAQENRDPEEKKPHTGRRLRRIHVGTFQI